MDYRISTIEEGCNYFNPSKSKTNGTSQSARFSLSTSYDDDRFEWNFGEPELAIFSPTVEFENMLKNEGGALFVSEPYEELTSSTNQSKIIVYANENNTTHNLDSFETLLGSELLSRRPKNTESENIKLNADYQDATTILCRDNSRFQSKDCFAVEGPQFIPENNLTFVNDEAFDLHTGQIYSSSTTISEFTVDNSYNSIMHGVHFSLQEEKFNNFLHKRSPDTHDYHSDKKVLERISKRKKHSPEAVAILKAWVEKHKEKPYPTKAEKKELSLISGLSIQSIQNWLSDYRTNTLKISNPARQQRLEFMIINSLPVSELRLFAGLNVKPY